MGVMSGFSGFADSQGAFFRSLSRNNNRDWFLAHKAEFEQGWNEPMKALLADVRTAIDRTYARCALDVPKVFRIFRDVRFAKDKSPYKTHVGGYIPLAQDGESATDLPMAIYFHVGAGEVFAAAGHYMMARASLERFRAAVADDRRGKELVKILGRLTKKGFATHVHDRSKRVPKGYPPDHPRAELLTYKGLTVMFPDVPKAMLRSPELVKWLASGCKATAPLVEWLGQTSGP